MLKFAGEKRTLELLFSLQTANNTAIETAKENEKKTTP